MTSPDVGDAARYVARGAPFFRAVWNEGRTYLCWDEPATHATPLGVVIMDA